MPVTRVAVRLVSISIVLQYGRTVPRGATEPPETTRADTVPHSASKQPDSTRVEGAVPHSAPEAPANMIDEIKKRKADSGLEKVRLMKLGVSKFTKEFLEPVTVEFEPTQNS